MKILLLISLLCSSLIIHAQSLFNNSLLHEIRITSTETNFWETLETENQQWLDSSIQDRPYHSVTIEIDGNTIQEVGVKQKGFASNFFAPTTKKPIKLNFGKYLPEQRYGGVKKLNLINGIGDAAMIKEFIVYDVFRQHGVPAPRVAHTKVFINDVYWGIYGMVEQIDKRFLKRNFADKTGNLWKNIGDTSLNTDIETDFPFELQTNVEENDNSKFFEFVEFINDSSQTDFENGIENIFDLDEFLRILAIDVITNNWDSYLDNGRNFYLYHEPKTDKIHWIPWDYNFSLDYRNQLHFTVSQPALPIQKLVIRILNIPAFKSLYLQYLCEILEVNFTNERLDPKIDQHLNLIANDWNASNIFYSLQHVQNELNENTWTGAFDHVSDGFSGNPSLGLKNYIEVVTNDVLDQIPMSGHTCTSIDASINSQDVVINEFMAQNLDDSSWFDQDNEHDDWVELYNNTNQVISLKNYFLSDSASFMHKWRFPEDASIPANGYLIVWTDKDPQQFGLHTKFKLDKNGDELYLSYLDGTIIDSVDYDEQIENTSMSRVPNGTGEFVAGDVTFNATNTHNSASISDFTIHGIDLYPNPIKDVLNINFTNIIASKINVKDILGRTIYSTKTINKNQTINLSNWSKGVYFVEVINKNYHLTKKIIKN